MTSRSPQPQGDQRRLAGRFAGLALRLPAGLLAALALLALVVALAFAGLGVALVFLTERSPSLL